MNLSHMIERHGINRVGFFTATFADNVTDRAEAQRRWNNFACGYLKRYMSESIAFAERQERGALHYHVACVLPWDIRTGFDFEAARMAGDARTRGAYAEQRAWQRRYYASANPMLREWWRQVREAAPRFEFGRCETLPVLTNGEAIARYVGGYVGSEWITRRPEDRGLRTIRYGLETRTAKTDFQWTSGAGELWRKGCAILGSIIGSDDFVELLGKRWAFYWRDEVSLFGRWFAECSGMLGVMSDLSTCVERIAKASSLAGVLKKAEASGLKPGLSLAGDCNL